MNRYFYEDRALPTISGEPNPESGHQWSRDVGNSTAVQWHTYNNNLDEDIYELHRPVPQHQHQLQHAAPLPQQCLTPQGSRYPQALPQPFQMSLGHGMHRPNQQLFTQDALPYLGTGAPPGSVARTAYPDVYARAQPTVPAVLRHLRPSNEQTRSLASVQPEMRRKMATHTGPGGELQSLAASLANFGPSTSQMRHLTTEGQPSVSPRMTGVSRSTPASWANSLPYATRAVSTAVPQQQRLKSTNSTSPIKELKNSPAAKNSPVKGKTKARKSNEKENTAADTLRDKVPNKFADVGVRFVTASVPDVLRFKTSGIFSDLERYYLLFEVVGTVFEVSGAKPVQISVHSQNAEINGIFWETDRWLDRAIVQTGSLIRVVLRIPPKEENSFHFVSLQPVEARPGIESHYRRIAYICSNTLGKQSQKN